MPHPTSDTSDTRLAANGGNTSADLNPSTSANPKPTLSSQPYSTVLADLHHERETILTLWRAGLTHSGVSDEKFSWYYESNPAGMPDVYFLNHAESLKPVGTSSIGVRPMRFGNTMLQAGALVDFVTLTEHRTLFPALYLQKQILKNGLANHALLYGLPNPHSHAVVKRAGYKLVGQMIRHVRVLRSASYLARYIPHYMPRFVGHFVSHFIGSIIDQARRASLWISNRSAKGAKGFSSQWLPAPDARFDDLWQRAVVDDVLMGSRNLAFLQWRFVACPYGPYQFFVLASDDGKSIAGYAICQHDSDTLHVRDFLVDAKAVNSHASLWSALSVSAYEKGYARISVQFLGAESFHRELDAAGYSQRDERPLYAAATNAINATNATNPTIPISTLSAEIILNEKFWYITSADEDW